MSNLVPVVVEQTSRLGIYDTMRYIRCDVATTCLGWVASAAAVILAAVDLTARINPARSSGHAYACLRAAQSLATEARALLAALELMWERGEREIHVPALTQALRALDGERRAGRVTIP
jgi:Clp protease